MKRTLLRALLLLGIGVALLTFSSEPSNANESLESRIQSASGISRTVDASLQIRAANRAIQIQTEWGHCCLVYGEAEIIGWDAGFADPVGQLVIGWVNSPPHAAILFDPDYASIGCAVAVSGTRTYGVCLFRVAGSTSKAQIPAITLPNAAMPTPSNY